MRAADPHPESEFSHYVVTASYCPCHVSAKSVDYKLSHNFIMTQLTVFNIKDEVNKVESNRQKHGQSLSVI